MSVEFNQKSPNKEQRDSLPEPSVELSPRRRQSQKLNPTVRNFFKRRTSMKVPAVSSARRSSLPRFIQRSSYRGAICFLCEEQHNKNDLDTVGGCTAHFFCRDCLKKYCLYKINVMEDVVCPEEDCNFPIDPQGSVLARLSEQTRRKFQRNQLWKQTMSNPNLKLCPSQKCQGIIDLTQGQYKCPKCLLEFCQECLLPRHHGNCDRNFEQCFKDWRRCPNCHVFIEKTDGCNHMVCKCSFQFCYVCQGTWSDVHYHCQHEDAEDEERQGQMRRGLTNCLLNTILRRLERIHIYNYQIREWSRVTQVFVGTFLIFTFALFVILMLPLLVVDTIFIIIIAFFCGPFIVYGDQMKWWVYVLWPFMSVIALFVGFYVGLHYELSLMTSLINDYWRIIGVSLCEYKPPQFIPVDGGTK